MEPDFGGWFIADESWKVMVYVKYWLDYHIATFKKPLVSSPLADFTVRLKLRAKYLLSFLILFGGENQIIS